MLDDDVEIPEIALARIVTMPQAAKLSSLSADSLRRHYRDKIVKLSPHREGSLAARGTELTTLP